MGVMAFDPVWAERTHTSAGFELLHIVRGTVRLECGGRVHVGRPGDTLLVPPHTRHRDRFDLAEGLEVFFCEFDWERVPAGFKSVTNARLLVAPPPVRAEISAIVDRLRTDLGGSAVSDRRVTQARLLTLLMILWRAGTSRHRATIDAAAAVSGRQRLLRQARAYMETHYAEWISLDAIADALHVSPYHLSHVFSKESDLSLFDYLTSLRMDRAQILLREKMEPVAVVARAVGYQDPNYFSKVFKRQCGCRPRDYAAVAARTSRNRFPARAIDSC